MHVYGLQMEKSKHVENIKKIEILKQQMNRGFTIAVRKVSVPINAGNGCS